MDSISQLSDDLTILIIAHRPTTVAGCDMIVTLENGQLLSLEPALAQSMDRLSIG